MYVSTEEIKKQFEGLIEGINPREYYASWAAEKMIAEDNNELEYESPKDETKIWNGIKYLLGVDLRGLDGEYLHSIDNFIEFKNKMNF